MKGILFTYNACHQNYSVGQLQSSVFNAFSILDPNLTFRLQVIALVMDVFTDVDLFCDLIEASSKRKVPVYILLDEKNLDCFLDMCSTLEIVNSHLAVSLCVSEWI